MTTQPDYSKIYTHAPEQHPNLILGSLQLLFWMFFRPTAFKNHLKRIHPVLESDISLITVLRGESYIRKKPALWKFILQGFFILPISLTVLARTVIILFFMALGPGSRRKNLVYCCTIAARRSTFTRVTQMKSGRASGQCIRLFPACCATRAA